MDDTATATETRRRLFHRIGDIEPTAPKWLVKGICEIDSLVGLFGDPEAGKSFIAASLAAAVATNRRWYDREVRRAGPVLYVAGEGRRGLRRRLRAWEIDADYHLGDTPLYVSDRPIPFGDPAALGHVIPEADEIAELEGEPTLIVVDTLSRNLAGDENSSLDMPAFVQHMDYLRARYGATILVVHHSGHAEKNRSRGHSAFGAALDTAFRAYRDPKRGPVRLEPAKTKDSEPPEPMQFEFRGVELDVVDEDGLKTHSAVLDMVPYSEPEQPRNHRGKWKDVALSVLEKLEADKPDGMSVLFETWRRTCKERDMPRQRFSEVAMKLEEEGKVSRKGAFVTLL